MINIILPNIQFYKFYTFSKFIWDHYVLKLSSDGTLCYNGIYLDNQIIIYFPFRQPLILNIYVL